METLKRQQIISQSIDKIQVNFKKDSVSRKTKEYIQKRLVALNDLWGEFVTNPAQLEKSGLSDVLKSEYFTNKAFDKVQLMYEAISSLLQDYKPRDTEERGVPSKMDELFGQQYTNFRAFSRLLKQLDIDNLTEKWEIEDKIQSLQARWRAIDELHWQIDNQLIGANVDYEQEFSQYESVYENTKKKLNMKLNATAHQYRAVPQIEIPTFSGNYAQWPTFMDLYCEAIHKKPSLSKGQKMQHLKGKVRGEAERIIQHLTVSAENYDTCWDILTPRHNNIQLLFTNQIQTFLNQAAIQSV